MSVRHLQSTLAASQLDEVPALRDRAVRDWKRKIANLADRIAREEEERRVGPDDHVYNWKEFQKKSAEANEAWDWEIAALVDSTRRPPWKMAQFFQQCVTDVVVDMLAEESVRNDSDMSIAYAKAIGREVAEGQESAVEILAAHFRACDISHKLASSIVQKAAEFSDAAAATGEALNDKFASEEGAFEMSYGKESDFAHGLEPMIGSPDPRIFQAIAKEHLESCTCTKEFTTGNYGITTNARTEFLYTFHVLLRDTLENYDQINNMIEGRADRFVSKLAGVASMVYRTLGRTDADMQDPAALSPPDQLLFLKQLEKELGLKQWPKETKSAHYPREKFRSRDWLSSLARRDKMLERSDQKEVLLEEALVAHLYTGPMFEVYNTVCRGGSLIHSAPKVMRDKFDRLCKGDNDEHNRLPTSIHTLRSALIKLSKLTKAGTVMRGISGGVLPPQFWSADASSGVKGGVEYGFFSTTLDRTIAMQYAKQKGAGTVLEMTTGMIDRGADLSWLSQYPHEQELCFPPLTSLQVLETRVEGGVLIVSVRLNVNLTEGTIDEVVGKRKKIVRDMFGHFKSEVRAMARVSKSSVQDFQGRVEREMDRYLGVEPAWFNEDTNLLACVQMGVDLKEAADFLLNPSTADIKDARRVCKILDDLFPNGEKLPAEARAELQSLKERAKFEKLMEVPLTQLESQDAKQKASALQAIAGLHDLGVPCSNRFVRKRSLEESSQRDPDVRRAVVSVLGECIVAAVDAEAAAEAVPALLTLAEDTAVSSEVASELWRAAGREVAAAAFHASLPVVLQLSRHFAWEARKCAAHSLPACIKGGSAQAAGEAVAALLLLAQDKSWEVRGSCALALGRAAEVVERQPGSGERQRQVAEALLALAGDSDGDVAEKALEQLGRVARLGSAGEVFRGRLTEILQLAKGAARKHAMHMLPACIASEGGEATAQAVDELLQLASDTDWQVRQASAAALAYMAEVLQRLLDGEEAGGELHASLSEKISQLVRAMLELGKDREAEVGGDTCKLLIHVAMLEAAGPAFAQSLPDLLKCAKMTSHSMWPARRGAARSLPACVVAGGMQAAEEAVPLLLELARDVRWEVREASARALGYAAEAIQRLIEEGGRGGELESTLEEMFTQVVQTLVELEDDHDDEVRALVRSGGAGSGRLGPTARVAVHSFGTQDLRSAARRRTQAPARRVVGVIRKLDGTGRINNSLARQLTGQLSREGEENS